MQSRPLGTPGLEVPPLGFGAFKLGRNQGIKYGSDYDLPTESRARELIDEVLDLGIRYIDTAPAYKNAQKQLGGLLQRRRGEVFLVTKTGTPSAAEACLVSTKVGETFCEGESRYDFSAEATRLSVARSRERLGRDVLDLVLVHSDGNDLPIQEQTDVVGTLQQLKAEGAIRAIGFSGKTVEGARRALAWAGVMMVEYHVEDPSHGEVMHEARQRGVGVIVKKGLASGRLDPKRAIRFVFDHPGVTSLVVGSLDPRHLAANVNIVGDV